MRLSTLVAAALLAMALFPVSLALSFEQQSGSSADGSSRIVDPDQQLDLFGLQNPTQGNRYDQSSNAPNSSQTLNAPNQGVAFPNPFAPLVEPRR